MQRKPGGYRQPSTEQRKQSKISKSDFNDWFKQIWNITGASTKNHPAPFPLKLVTRLVRMFSFYNDTVLDPFCGSGTTMIAALRNGRNSIGIDIDKEYCQMAARNLKAEINNSSSKANLIFQKMTNGSSGKTKICEDQILIQSKNREENAEIDSKFTWLRFCRFNS